MGLTLVTGPANSAKAQVVLERFRAALARAPILVVPRSADAEHYRRELADSGVVLGARVEPFGGLMRELASRAGVGARPIGERAREALVAAAVAGTPLRALAPISRSPTFTGALVRFIAELEARRIEPPRLAAALHAWAVEGTRRRAYADELARLYGAYRRRLDRLGRLDEQLHALATLDALVLDPARWGATPVFLYGFDDLEQIQTDVVETLAHRVGAPVVLSLPGEPGRAALAGRATTLETLRPGADEVIELEALSTYYEDPLLHHLERSLFEPAPARPLPGRAVRLLEGGDRQAEAELVAEEIAGLIAEGFPPGDIAIVTRGAGEEVLAGALEQFAIPYSRRRRGPLATSALGAGLLALLRCAAGDGEASDLIAWLRLCGEPGVDDLEAWVRRSSGGSFGEARAHWRDRHQGRLDSLRGLEAAAGDAGALLDAVAAALDLALAASAPRAAALLDPWEAAAAAAVRRTLGELRELARAHARALGGPGGVARALAEAAIDLAGAGDGGAVSICDALSLRARRVRALFIVAVQDGEFPAPARERPFLGTADRAELAQASGLLLERPPDQLAAERYLFYALCSRPTARLRVSWHSAGDGGDPRAASLFIDDLRDCFEESLYEDRSVRAAGELRFALAPAGRRELERLLDGERHAAAPIAALADPERLAALRASSAYSASALERWADCPVAWLVDRALAAHALEPDSVPQLRGTRAHDVLAVVLSRLAERLGSARLDSGSLQLALELLDEALAQPAEPISPQPIVEATEARRLQIDLARYLRSAAESPGTFVPQRFELGFGMGEESEFAAVELAEGLVLRGRIDRIDVDAAGGEAIVVDYKTGGDVPPVACWRSERRLQQALYMKAAEALLGVEAVGGLYQPLRRADLRPRGAIVADAEPQGPEPFANDRIGRDELGELLTELVELATAIAAELAAGAIEPRPVTCSSRGGCMFPTICRCEYV